MKTILFRHLSTAGFSLFAFAYFILAATRIRRIAIGDKKIKGKGKLTASLAWPLRCLFALVFSLLPLENKTSEKKLNEEIAMRSAPTHKPNKRQRSGQCFVRVFVCGRALAKHAIRDLLFQCLRRL